MKRFISKICWAIGLIVAVALVLAAGTFVCAAIMYHTADFIFLLILIFLGYCYIKFVSSL